MEITKEEFHKAIQGLTTQLEETETRIIAHIDDSQAELARMTKQGFDDVMERFDVRQKVEELQRQLREVQQELNIA